MAKTKIDKLLAKYIQLANKQELSVSENIELLGRLCFVIGGSLAGLKGKEQIQEEMLRELYKHNQTLDIALMLSGIHILSWIEDFEKNPVISKIKEKLDKTE